jgi:hypothetical protein
MGCAETPPGRGCTKRLRRLRGSPPASDHAVDVAVLFDRVGQHHAALGSTAAEEIRKRRADHRTQRILKYIVEVVLLDDSDMILLVEVEDCHRWGELDTRHYRWEELDLRYDGEVSYGP